MLNVTTKKYPYPLAFTNEVINIVIGHKVFFLNDFFILLDFHSIWKLVQKNFCIDKGTFVWVVMPFGVKNGPPTYQRVVTHA